MHLSGCAVCAVPVERGRLMCLHHWRKVPTPLAMAVNRTWRNFLRSEAPERRLNRLKLYRAARQAAIDAVNGAPITTPGDLD